MNKPSAPLLPSPAELPAKEVYVTWGIRVTATHHQQLAAMISTAPRHVRKQDLMGYILREFFRQHPELPEELRQRPPRS